MPRDTKRYPLPFKKKVKKVREHYRKGDLEGRVHYCDACQNLEHHLFVPKDDTQPDDPSGLTCVNCCAIFDG